MRQSRRAAIPLITIVVITVILISITVAFVVFASLTGGQAERKKACGINEDCSWFRTTIAATAKNPVIGRPRAIIDNVSIEPLEGGLGLSLPNLGFFANYHVKVRYVVTTPSLDVVEGETATQTGRIGIGGERSHTLDFDIFGPSGSYTVKVVLMFKEGDKAWWDDDTRSVVYTHAV